MIICHFSYEKNQKHETLASRGLHIRAPWLKICINTCVFACFRSRPDLPNVAEVSQKPDSAMERKAPLSRRQVFRKLFIRIIGMVKGLRWPESRVQNRWEGNINSSTEYAQESSGLIAFALVTELEVSETCDYCRLMMQSINNYIVANNVIMWQHNMVDSSTCCTPFQWHPRQKQDMSVDSEYEKSSSAVNASMCIADERYCPIVS